MHPSGLVHCVLTGISSVTLLAITRVFQGCQCRPMMPTHIDAFTRRNHPGAKPKRTILVATSQVAVGGPDTFCQLWLFC